MDCYNYKPHFHPERLKQYLPKNKLIFLCGYGDICFAFQSQIKQIFDVVKEHKDKTFLVQTKMPECLVNYEVEYIIPDNVIVGTTIETNRDTKNISKAPVPEIRMHDLRLIQHRRKFITHEPIMDFDLDVLVDWDKSIHPEIIWIGYNSHPESISLNEPPLTKTRHLITDLDEFTDVRQKIIRDKV
jgi:protein gp37